MKNTVLNTINRNSLIEKGDTVTVGLSGGADSSALIFVLNEIKDDLGFNLRAAHLNHMLRGKEADRDEEFSRNFAESLGVEFVSKRVDVKKYAEENSLSIELAARQVRYDFFSSLGGKIATAHTASDNAETVIFNLTRGTAIKGLCGIPVKRDNIIRPLLQVTREQVEAYCADNGISFVTDSTNLKEDYSRNKIRLSVFEKLKEINPAVVLNISRMTEVLFEDSQYLDNVAADALSVFYDNSADVADLVKLPPAILKRVLFIKAAELMSESPDSRDIEIMYKCVKNSAGGVELQKDLFFKVENSKAYFYKSNNEHYEYNVKFDIFERASFNVNNLFLKNALDYDKIFGNLIIRNREPSDKIKLAGRGVTKTLKQLFCEKKLGIYERSVLPVAADDLGVIWIYGIGVAERCRITDDTKNICAFNVYKKSGDE